MDEATLKAFLEDLSPEELSMILGDGKGQKPADPAPAPVTQPPVDTNQLADEVARRLNRTQTPPTPQAPAPQPAKFDQNKFAELLIKDAREAQEYLETATYGAPVSKLIPVLVATVANQQQKLQEIDTRTFLRDNSDFVPNKENRQIIEGILAENNWQPSYENLRNATLIAKGLGQLKTNEAPAQPAEPQRPFVPPRVKSQQQETDEARDAAILNSVNELTDEQLELLLMRRGVISTPHLRR